MRNSTATKAVAAVTSLTRVSVINRPIHIAAAFYNKELERRQRCLSRRPLSKKFHDLYPRRPIKTLKDDVDGTAIDGSTLDVVASYPITDSYKNQAGRVQIRRWWQ